MTEKTVNISIRIADLPRLPLSIPSGQEEIVRRAEANINELWRKWSVMAEFRDKSSAEILAMVTFRFAQLYYSLQEASGKVERVLQGLDNSLSEALFGIEKAEKAEEAEG